MFRSLRDRNNQFFLLQRVWKPSSALLDEGHIWVQIWKTRRLSLARQHAAQGLRKPRRSRWTGKSLRSSHELGDSKCDPVAEPIGKATDAERTGGMCRGRINAERADLGVERAGDARTRELDEVGNYGLVVGRESR